MVYFYKLTTDDGGAPCVDGGLLSLAICKPMIRRTAEPGDLIVGFSANSLDRRNRLIYIARITDKMRSGDYYIDGRFAKRSDCIYERRSDRFVRREGAEHHCALDLLHDLGEHPQYSRAQVLVSDDFRYFGADGTDSYKAMFPSIGAAVEGMGRWYRVLRGGLLWDEFQRLRRHLWSDSAEKVAGPPSSQPGDDRCHKPPQRS